MLTGVPYLFKFFYEFFTPNAHIYEKPNDAFIVSVCNKRIQKVKIGEKIGNESVFFSSLSELSTKFILKFYKF